MTCMKMNYVELFDFIIERDGLIAIENASRLSIYSLLYYAVYNGHVEILRRGIEVGCELSTELIDITVSMYGIVQKYISMIALSFKFLPKRD